MPRFDDEEGEKEEEVPQDQDPEVYQALQVPEFRSVNSNLSVCQDGRKKHKTKQEDHTIVHRMSRAAQLLGDQGRSKSLQGLKGSPPIQRRMTGLAHQHREEGEAQDEGKSAEAMSGRIEDEN